jgi:hypothetical protein
MPTNMKYELKIVMRRISYAKWVSLGEPLCDSITHAKLTVGGDFLGTDILFSGLCSAATARRPVTPATLYPCIFGPTASTEHLFHLFQIKREIATMKLIRHPNVVQLHEVCCKPRGNTISARTIYFVSFISFRMCALDRLWQAKQRYTWFLTLLMEESFLIRS